MFVKRDIILLILLKVKFCECVSHEVKIKEVTTFIYPIPAGKQTYLPIISHLNIRPPHCSYVISVLHVRVRLSNVNSCWSLHQTSIRTLSSYVSAKPSESCLLVKLLLHPSTASYNSHLHNLLGS